VAPWFLGNDPDNSPQGGSPSSRDDGDSHVIRRLPVTDPAAPGELLRSAGQGHDLQARETLVRFPQPLMHLFPELSSGR
jgi:hypothetical protein